MASESSKDDVTIRQLKSLVKFMRENGVAEFSVGETTVKFAFQRHAETPTEAIESSERFEEFQKSMGTHLDGRSHAQREQDEQADLMWST